MLVVIVITLSIVCSIAWVAFRAYDAKNQQLEIINLKSKLTTFASQYEYLMTAIASQPVFLSLLNSDEKIIQKDLLPSSELFNLKRQIASFTAKHQQKTIFEGYVIYNNKRAIITQGKISSPYYITTKVCYRDSVLSYTTGSPCLGSWKLFISENKLKNILKNKGFDLTNIKKAHSTLQLSKFFEFDSMKLESYSLPENLYLAIKTNVGSFKYYMIISVIFLFLMMLFLIILLRYLYTNFYLKPIKNLHTHLQAETKINPASYTNTPKEITDFVSAINFALKNKRLEAVGNLVHDLKRPLNQLQKIANSIPGSFKQHVMNIYTQIFLSVNKLHDKQQENIDLKKLIYDCVLTIYEEQYRKNIISIKISNNTNYFCQASYSHLLRVFSNLIDNALKATEGLQKPKIDIVLTLNYQNIISIYDNGKGILKEHIPFIFNENTSFSNSTGQGLHYSRKTVEQFLGTIEYTPQRNQKTCFTIKLPLAKAPHDFIDKIFYNKKTRFVIIDDEVPFYQTFINRLKNIQCIYLRTLTEVKNYFIQEKSLNDIYIVDYHFANEITGISIINSYKLLKQSYLFSTAGDFIRETYSHLRDTLPIISKNQIDSISFVDVTLYNSILVDDDQEVLEDAKQMAIAKNIKLLTLNNFLQLQLVSSLINKNTPITLDNKVENLETSGIKIAEILHKNGFQNIAIQSGDTLNIEKLPYLKCVLEKGNFLYE